MAALALAGGCAPARTPPDNLAIDGLPVTGTLAFARRLGFDRCQDFNAYLRCRRAGVVLVGQGPYEAAVDARGSDGGGGFRLLTLWSERDQEAVLAVGDALLAQGWALCRTGTAEHGDQHVWRKPGAKVRVSIDVSYWGKRRLRLMPETGQPTGRCW